MGSKLILTRNQIYGGYYRTFDRVATQFLSQNSRTIQGHFKDFSVIFANFQGLFDTKFKDFKDTEKIPKLKKSRTIQEQNTSFTNNYPYQTGFSLGF